MMHPSPATANVLQALDEHSQQPLKCRSDLGLLIELASQNNAQRQLDDLSFTAKFLSRSYGIMQRIGRNGQGYDQLSKEFAFSLEKARGLIHSLIISAPEDVRGKFDSSYFALTSDSLQNLLSLFQDLGRYKNWRMDGERSGRHRS